MSEERRIKNIAEYLAEISKVKAKSRNSVLAFRGQENRKWRLESSAERRLKASFRDEGRIPKWLFIDYHRDLLNKCKLKNYDQRKGKPLDELELLADLQHHGAATCLLDFTRNALVALWFACQKSSPDGKVFIVNMADETAFLEITPPDIENRSISDILDFKTRETGKDQAAEPPTRETSMPFQNEPNFWYWTPAHLNERIPAQRSLFLFGLPSSEELRPEELVIKSSSKKHIRRELNDLHDIHEESLFPDFVGFAYTQRSNAAYDSPSGPEYIIRGAEAQRRGRNTEAVEYLTRAIELGGHLDAYYHRAHTYLRQGEFELAIQDLSKMIESIILLQIPVQAEPYQARGLAYLEQGEYGLAIKDFSEVIERNPDIAQVFYARGLAQLLLGEWAKAKLDIAAAQNKGLDITALWPGGIEDITKLEQTIGTKMPNIAAILAKKGNES